MYISLKGVLKSIRIISDPRAEKLKANPYSMVAWLP
jgi:hypothetical protein